MIANIELTSEEVELRLYIPDDLRIRTYTTQLRLCKSLKEAEERVMISMIRNENIPLELVSREEFYSRIAPFLTGIKKLSRTTLWNHFTDLANLLKRQKDNEPVANLSLFGTGIELPKVQPGEEARYTIEVIITASGEKADHLIMSAVLTGVDYRKVEIKNFDAERLGLQFVCSYSLRGSVSMLHQALSYIHSLFGAEAKVSVQYISDYMDRDGVTIQQAIEWTEREV